MRNVDLKLNRFAGNLENGDFSWSKAVELELTCGLMRNFKNTYDALDFLDAEWPTRHGFAYHRAMLLCRKALQRPFTADAARKAFIAAAAEAGMPARG